METDTSTLVQQIQELSPLDWVATACALVYVLLAARDNNWCWLFAAISAVAWAYQSYFTYQLVSDALLQVFYLVMAGVGLYRWRRNEKTEDPEISRMTTTDHLIMIVMCTCLGLGLGFAVSMLGTAFATYLDATTTVFSIAATFLLVWRKLENWLYWVVVDGVYVYIYLKSGALLFALLMLLYIVIAVYGYYQWRLAIYRSDEVTA